MTPHEEIFMLLSRYFDGLYRGDVALLRTVFHPQAILFGEVGGQPYLRTLDDYLAIVAGRKSPQFLREHFRMKPLSVEVLGPIGNARVSCPMLGYNYVDYLALLRKDDQWQIVNKLFTHVAAE